MSFGAVAVSHSALKVVIEAAEKHLATLPKVEIIETWHVEWCHQDNRDAAREPKVSVHWSHAAARQDAQRLRESPLNKGQWTCITVTGPHKHTVPA